ncbi:MAG: phosphoribosylanthranilate isomerase [Solirubrobacteraceae bacterium]|jgi:phosphoribosylanthranilate isomerase|nr:phosphoribosylanthranilate isomerase [Solirubrobacteraceae bacterium]
MLGLAPNGLTDVAMGARLKVCGITEPAEIEVLGAQPVDFVGLWHGVSGGPAELGLEDWRALAGAAVGTPGLNPVLVTFLKDAGVLGEALAGSGVTWVQLHGYQTPGLVRAVKRIAPDEIRVIKVLHVRGDDCVEGSLIGSYEKAGVDVFLLDAVAGDGRVGSTGETLDADVAWSLAERMNRPFLLAGGISAGNRGDYDRLAGHPRFLGIDVDTNARGADGKVSAANVEAISRAWKGERHG